MLVASLDGHQRPLPRLRHRRRLRRARRRRSRRLAGTAARAAPRRLAARSIGCASSTPSGACSTSTPACRPRPRRRAGGRGGRHRAGRRAGVRAAGPPAAAVHAPGPAAAAASIDANDDGAEARVDESTADPRPQPGRRLAAARPRRRRARVLRRHRRSARPAVPPRRSLGGHVGGRARAAGPARRRAGRRPRPAPCTWPASRSRWCSATPSSGPPALAVDESPLGALLRAVDTTLWIDRSDRGDRHGAGQRARRPADRRRPACACGSSCTTTATTTPCPRPTSQHGERRSRRSPSAAITVRLGALSRFDDGVLGYYLDDDYSVFHPVHAAVRELARHGWPAGRLPRRGRRGRGSTATTLTAEPITGAVRAGRRRTSSLRPGRDVDLTVLVLAGLGINATCGVVPRKRLELNRSWTDAALQQIVPSFRVGPVLVDPASIRMPRISALPEDPDRPAAQHVDPARHADDVAGRPDPGRHDGRPPGRPPGRRATRAGPGSWPPRSEGHGEMPPLSTAASAAPPAPPPRTPARPAGPAGATPCTPSPEPARFRRRGERLRRPGRRSRSVQAHAAAGARRGQLDADRSGRRHPRPGAHPAGGQRTDPGDRGRPARHPGLRRRRRRRGVAVRQGARSAASTTTCGRRSTTS